MKKYFVPNSINTSFQRKIKGFLNPLIQHEDEFKEILKDVSSTLLKLSIKDKSKINDYEVIFFPISGSGTIEALVSGFNKKNLVISNGEYGNRLFNISKFYNKHAEIFKHSMNDIYSLDEEHIEEKIENGGFKIVSMVHVEESSGIINDISKIGKICKKTKSDFVVDACSSFGAKEIDMVDMNISALVSTSDKNIEALPGISFIIIKKDFLFKLIKRKCKSSFLCLKKQFEFQKEENRIRYTIPVFSFLSLQFELKKLTLETIHSRNLRYERIWEILINKMQKIGIEPVVPEEYQSKLITAFNPPLDDKYSFDEINKYLESNGFIIYPGKINEMDTFRISNIGEIKEYEIKALVNQIEEFFQTL
jgi:2-aminoethylphosphonate-pyruvate transaminase